MRWRSKKNAEPTVTTVYVDDVKVDEAIAKIEAASKKLDAQYRLMELTIKRAKAAKDELEVAITQAKRKQRGVW